jgi:hypothetical protein
MFIGHFGLGLAAKKLNPRPSLGTYFLAAQFIDLLWPFFLLLGWEKVAIQPGNTAFTPLDFISYPYSHSFLAVLIWAFLFGTVYYSLRKDKTTALLLALLVVSHWLLDLLTHRPDLPLSFSGSIKLGLGLWNYKVATLVVEIFIFLSGSYLYASATKAKNKTGLYAFGGLIIFLLALYLMSAFGSPPPDVKSIGYVGVSQWLLIAWGYWVDKNREAR